MFNIIPAPYSLRDMSETLNRRTPCQSLLRSLCSVPPVEVGVVCAAKFPFDDKYDIYWAIPYIEVVFHWN